MSKTTTSNRCDRCERAGLDIDSVEFALTSKGLQSSNDPWIAMRRANRVAVWAAVCTTSRRGRFAELLNAEDDAGREFDRKARATIDLLQFAFQTAGRNVNGEKYRLHPTKGREVHRRYHGTSRENIKPALSAMDDSGRYLEIGRKVDAQRERERLRVVLADIPRLVQADERMATIETLTALALDLAMKRIEQATQALDAHGRLEYSAWMVARRSLGSVLNAGESCAEEVRKHLEYIKALKTEESKP